MLCFVLFLFFTDLRKLDPFAGRVCLCRTWESPGCAGQVASICPAWPSHLQSASPRVKTNKTSWSAQCGGLKPSPRPPHRISITEGKRQHAAWIKFTDLLKQLNQSLPGSRSSALRHFTSITFIVFLHTVISHAHFHSVSQRVSLGPGLAPQKLCLAVRPGGSRPQSSVKQPPYFNVRLITTQLNLESHKAKKKSKLLAEKYIQIQGNHLSSFANELCL